MSGRLRAIVARALLAFVLVSIGYALGREVERHAHEPAAPVAADEAGVIVYYFHGTTRCATCNSIERMARETLEAEFAEQLADGRLRWRLENFQTNEALAERYGVASSTLVVVRRAEGEDVEFERLDQVWEFVHEPVMFRDYIRYEVQEMLEAGQG